MASRKTPTHRRLEAYRAKRSAERTPEPFGAPSAVRPRLFVVQKHAATRLREFSDPVHRRQTALGRQLHLFINDAGQHEIVPIDPVPSVAEGSVRAYTFQRAADPETTYVLLWSKNDPVRLRLHVPAERVTLMQPFGKRLAIESADAVTVVEVASRRYLRLARSSPEQAKRILERASK